MQYNLRAPSAWQFVAGNGSDAVNSWGQPRAYAIVPTGACGVSVRPSRDTVYTPAGVPSRMGRLRHHSAALHPHRMRILAAVSRNEHNSAEGSSLL